MEEAAKAGPNVEESRLTAVFLFQSCWMPCLAQRSQPKIKSKAMGATATVTRVENVPMLRTISV